MRTSATVGLFSLLASVLVASSASAACRELLYSAEAKGRNAWAMKVGYITPDQRTTLDNQGKYVEFTSGCYRLSAGGTCNPVIPVTESGALVGGLIPGDFCAQYDCYVGDVELRTGDESMAIERAAAAELATITTLATDASPEAMTLSEQPVKAFSFAPVSEPIHVLVGDGGQSIAVTGGHPMVRSDGSIVPARDLVEGDTLAGAEGKPIQLVAIHTRPYDGKVWNVELVSEEKAENIVLANGFLAGSMRFQMDWAHDSFRLFVRDSVAVEELVASP